MTNLPRDLSVVGVATMGRPWARSDTRRCASPFTVCVTADIAVVPLVLSVRQVRGEELLLG